MCGIAGICLLKSSTVLPDFHKRLSLMAQAMSHRGPDDEGIFVTSNGRVGLASRRLAIRDLSPAGHMPMSNAAQTVWIVYNGEIYNTQELRPELERLGYQFHSQSDTEVILHGYEAWGEKVVERIRGMFAFAILDTRESAPPQLFLARDRLGIKPLYYTRQADLFLFASELKTLRASNALGHDISAAGLVGYLMLGSVPNPLTIYEGVSALEPGHTLTLPLDAGASDPIIKPYWSLPTEVLENISYQDALEQVRALLEEAVRIRLVSDVPLGAFLSGGLDSSAVVALMRKATTGTIRTCSMIFEEATYSEAHYAKAMAEAVGAEHYERVITANDLMQELDRILWAMDQPTIDGVNSYFVSQTARQAGLTVALSGLGGDELFGGYPNTFLGVPQMMRSLQRAQSVPGGAAVARMAIGLLPNRHRGARVQDALGRPLSPASAYLARRGLFSWSEVQALLSPDIWQEALKTFDPIRHIAERADLNGHASKANHQAFDQRAFAPQAFAWTSRAELSTYTHHQLLRDTDVMSMAHSLEVRVPLLDHKLVEASLKLPAHIKQAGTGPKPLLNAALQDLLPPIISQRTDKQGFTFPFDRWIQQLKSNLLQDNAIRSKLSSGLNPTAVEQMWNRHAAGKMHWSRPWALAVLQSWMQASG
ncbi:MAG: asparagine synthase (glutamine-hydrolyzing) [Abitibacteriaceae bacterium]|nr:asparagine synthase (glutamine-hydrolyzing) [Abditibacteriaceae bacterium]